MADLKGAATLAVSSPLVPRVLVLAAAAVLLGIGMTAFSQLSERAGTDAAAAPALGDGPLTVSGYIENIVGEPQAGRTVITLRAADPLRFLVPGSAVGAYAVGEYVTATGVKAGAEVQVHSLTPGVHPGWAATPYLLFGGLLAAAVALDFVVPLVVKRGQGGQSPLGKLGGALSKIVRRGGEMEPPAEAGQGSADNRSGALAPKG